MADETDITTEETTEKDQTPDVQAELERMRTALKAANRESAERRKRLEELEAQEEARKTAEMTELERARAEKEAAEQRARDADARVTQTLIRSAFVAEAAKAGAVNPEDAYVLADKNGVEVADDGTVTGVAEAVKALVDAGRVPLSGKAPAPSLDGTAGGGDRPRHNAEKLTALEIDLAQKMGLTLEQYQKSKAAIAARTER